MGRARYIYVLPASPQRERYGFWSIMGDMFMLVITGGLWGFVMIVRENRRSRNR